MNPGLAIFRKRQRLQGGGPTYAQRGTENLEPGPLPPEKQVHGFKTKAGIYDPGPAPPRTQDDDEQGHTAVDPATEEQLRGVYGTIGINVDGEEHEVPLWHKDMTAEEAEDAARMRWEWDLSAFAPDSELEKVQNAAHQGPDDASALPQQHAKGTSNIMQTTPNQGLRLFMAHQKLKRPQAFAKGESGIHINPANKGKFTALQKATGKSTAELKNSPNPLTRQRANFAMMAKRHFKPL